MKTLRPYQEEDALKLTQYASTACFNEQRTGKTLTALRTISLRNLIDHRVLVISTLSGIPGWLQDSIDSNIPMRPCVGTPQKKIQIINEWTHGALIITYDSLKSTSSKTGLIKLILEKKPSLVILDEAHRIRKNKNFTTKAIMQLKGIPYKLALTGTPAYGITEDIANILVWLYPHKFKSIYAFKEEYMDKIFETIFTRQGRQVVTKYTNMNPIKEKELQEFLSQISTMRKRKDPDVMPWLPEKDYEDIKLPMTPEQRKAIEGLAGIFETEGLVVKGVLDRLIRYRQICNDPALVGLKGKSPKTEFIKNYIADNPDKPIIIFSNFTEYLHNLFDELESVAMIVGATSLKDRAKYQADFQAGKFNILLINISAGKEALTLDRAETVIFADKYPPLGDIQQAEDRFVATTEDKADKPHTIYSLMIADSFDEDINMMLSNRQSETDVINNFTKYIKERRK